NTKGWRLWNFLVADLLTLSPIILYDESPTHPHKKILWKLAEHTKMSLYGTSASYITACMKEGFSPKDEYDLSHLENISYTGSPLQPEALQWCYEHLKETL